MSKQSVEHHKVAIIGTGFSGLGMAIRLKKEGENDFIVFEKEAGVGGTWRVNHYPGCACDVPSHLYSFSFAPNPNWSRMFAPQPEIKKYLEHCAHHYDVMPHVKLNNAVAGAHWDDGKQLWMVTDQQGKQDSAEILVAGAGGLSVPAYPNIPGLDKFEGKAFHSQDWDHQYDLKGKRVAVIGTGASAIQFVPQIQPKVQSLFVFQRTAPWVLPKPDMPLGTASKLLLEKVPAIQHAWRETVASSLNVINLGLRHPSALKPVSQAAKQLLKLQVKDKALRMAVTPNFTLGCKRILFANNYYPALQADNTTLIPHGLVSVEGNTVIAANGERHEVDVIIWGTGFDVSHPPIGQRVVNANGERLSDLWKDSSPEAYLGTALADTPNAFLVLGPNVLVYDSFFRLSEAQLGYIVDGLKKMKQKGISKLAVKAEVLRSHNELVQKHIKGTVFNSGGCKSYYLDQNGRNFAAWPWSLARLQKALGHFRLGDYDVVFSPQAQRKAA